MCFCPPLATTPEGGGASKPTEPRKIYYAVLIVAGILLYIIALRIEKRA